MSFRKIIVKTLQFTRLNRLAHRYYYRHVHGFKTATKELIAAVEKVYHHAESLGTLGKGDYYEFGVFKGYTFWWSQLVAKRHPSAAHMRFFGFDSFQGLPEVHGVDQSKNDDFYQGQYTCSYESVMESLNRAGGVDWSRTFLTRGFFSESLTEARRAELNLKRIAIALVDCDLYSSTVEVLAFIEPMLMDNTILMMDDWNCFDKKNDRGQRKAFNEWMAMHPTWKREELFQYGHWGCVFLLRQA